VDRRERELILGEWGVRDQNLIERGDERGLERDLVGSPLRGRPLPRRLTLRPNADSYVLSLGGPLPYMVRLGEIEAETAATGRPSRIGGGVAWRGGASTP
jgi:hypothetical protein